MTISTLWIRALDWLIFERICRSFHGTPMTPVHGVYICPVCLREWPVPWQESPLRHIPKAPLIVADIPQQITTLPIETGIERHWRDQASEPE